MRRGLRVIGIATGILLVAGVGGAWVGWRWLHGTGLPQRDGEAKLAGLDAAVSVRFDATGRPHVDAESLEDLAAAVGWLHANDRMTQLELGRRAARGTLSEVVGESALTLDAEARHLDLAGTARRCFEVTGPEGRGVLEAYARGVNAWLAERGGDLPPGLELLGIEPEPWSPEDSLGFQMLMARDLSMLETTERQRTRAYLFEGTAEGVLDLFPERDSIHIPEGLAALRASASAGKAPGDGEAGGESGGEGQQKDGSNNWVVAGARSATGHPLLANDPHLGLSLPSPWYPARLVCPSYEAQGVMLVGLPLIVIGQGPDVAWSFTNSGLDNHDLLYEERNREGHVRRGSEWVPLIEHSETLRVRWGDDRTLRFFWSDLGPYLDEGPVEGGYSLLWSAFEPFDSIPTFLGLARASSLEEVLAAAEPYIAPAQNLLAVHREEGILQTVLGRMPNRPLGDGRLMAPAQDERYHWDGFLPHSANPTVIDPPEGYLASANEDVRRSGETRPFPGEYAVPHRADRARELVAAGEDWDVDSLAKMQSDAVSRFALEVVAKLGGPFEGTAGKAYDLLAPWDGRMGRNSAEAALFARVHVALHDAIFADELRAAGIRGGYGYSRNARLLRALDRLTASAAFDRIDTERREIPTDVIRDALTRAWFTTVQDLESEFPADWRYDADHTWTPSHPLSALPILGSKFSRDPIPLDGSPTSLNALAGYGAIRHGPSMRFVADPAAPDRSLLVVPGGQSGHPFDPHYDDQLEAYAEGRHFPMAWSEDAVTAATVTTLRLIP